MAFYSYDGVPDSVLDKQHTASTGETYSLRHNENLKVEMSYLGKGNINANSQGWERNSSKYFEVLYKSHPEMFSKKNVARIKDGHAPIVDQKMISSNPNWAQYRNQTLVHHHIGGDGEAVAIPKNAHKGQGEIHNYEKSAGITDKCKNFSQKCASNPDSIGKTTSQLYAKTSTKSISNNKAQTASTKTSNSVRISKSSTNTSTRSDAVRNSVSSKGNSSKTGRSQSVRGVGHSMNNSSISSRGDSVRNIIQSMNSKSPGQSFTQSSAGITHSYASNSSSTSQGNSHGGGRSSGGSGQGK